jgi:hypothetical protein
MVLDKPLKLNDFLYTAICSYFVFGLLLLPLYRYQINPDGISYISIAQKYLSGDFRNVVNGHWSPVFSWLLVPWLASGVDPLFAAKLLNLCIGVVTFFAMHRICVLFDLCCKVRIAVNLSLVPVLLYFAYHQITPDLLLTCMLLFYFNDLFSKQYVSGKMGVHVGVLGGICYLVKSYCLPFFLTHFTLINMLYFLQCGDSDERKKVLYNYVAGILVFACISGVWIGLLSKKYGEFTTTTQTAHNYQAISPEPPELYFFIPPPNDTAISVWEDPYVRIKKISWTPFKSLGAFKHWIKYGIRNIEPSVRMIAGFSVFSFLLCVGYFVWRLLKPCNLFADRLFSFAFLSAVLYAGGYCFILIDERYIWVVCLLAMLTGGYLLTKLLKKSYFQNSTTTIAVLVVFCLSFYVSPVINLFSTMNAGRSEYEVSRSLDGVIPLGTRIASNGDFYTTLFLCYHLKLQYYGTSESYEPELILQAMNTYDLDYFIEWDGGVQLNTLVPGNFIRIAERSLHGRTFAVLRRKIQRETS